MKKCGLRSFNSGGPVDPNGSDYDRINAEKTARWAMDDTANQMKYATPQEAAGLGRALGTQQAQYNQAFGARSFSGGGKVNVDAKGFIEGPGGVDNVPARVAETGEEIRVGAGERIVNKAQNKALEALAAKAGMTLDEYLEASTGKAVGPTLKDGLRAAQDGLPVPYDPVMGQQAAPGGANTYAPRSTTPVQDGVRTGAPNPAPRPNWIDPARQVAPVYEAPRMNQANVIEGSATRVPNGSGNSLVPTNGQTQFHDKISAEEMARGNQNRAAGFKAAAETSSTPATPPQAATPAAPETKMQAAKRVGGTALKGLNAAAAIGQGVYDVANANEPAEQAIGALKASGAAPGWAGIPGKIALYGDMGLKAMTGKSIAQHADSLAQLHPDYMLDKNRQWGTAGTRQAEQAPSPAPTATPKAPTPAASAPAVAPQASPTATPKAPTPAASAPAVAPQASPTGENDANVKLLRGAGVQGALTGDVVENGKTPSQGIRTIATTNGNVHAGRDARGVLNIASGNDRSGEQNEVLRAKEAARSQADLRRQAEAFERMGIESDLKSNDPRDVNSAVKRLSLRDADGKNNAKAAEVAAAAQSKGADRQVTMRGQDLGAAKAAEENAQKLNSEHAKRVDDMLKAKATVDGKLNGNHYTQLQAFAGNFKSEHENGTEKYFKDLSDNLEVFDKFNSDAGGLLRRVRSQGSDMPTGLRQESGPLWGEYIVDPRSRNRVSMSDAANMSPGGQQALLQNLEPGLRAQVEARLGIQKQQ